MADLVQTKVKDVFQKSFKSSVHAGCHGGSLGYFLVTGKEWRGVFTFFGSLPNLLHDLKSPLFPQTEIESNRALLLEGKIKEVFAQQ